MKFFIFKGQNLYGEKIEQMKATIQQIELWEKNTLFHLWKFNKITPRTKENFPTKKKL